MSLYPEHDKLDLIKNKTQVIGEFLEWLSLVKKYSICSYDENDPDEHDGFYPVNDSRDYLIASFFEIDRKELEKEKKQMLEEMRKLNK